MLKCYCGEEAKAWLLWGKREIQHKVKVCGSCGPEIQRGINPPDQHVIVVGIDEKLPDYLTNK